MTAAARRPGPVGRRVKAPDEDCVEIYVFAADEEAARAAVEAQTVYLELPELTEVDVHFGGPPELGPSI